MDNNSIQDILDKENLKNENINKHSRISQDNINIDNSKKIDERDASSGILDMSANGNAYNTDGRMVGQWESRYVNDPKARKIQKIEAIYLALLICSSLLLLVLNYNGFLSSFFYVPDEKEFAFSRIVTCTICGLFGGTVFDIKWFYRSIARGFWNKDRIYWRIFSPIISLAFAFCLGSILNENIITLGNGFSAATIGFLAGYFSDEAAGKMAEVAKVLFNTNANKEEKNKNIDYE